MINCFWVSGKYKGNGHGKELLNQAIADAMQQGKDGLVTIVGTKKFNFMSDTKWFLRQGFEICDSTPSGFSLMVKYVNREGKQPMFHDSVKLGECDEKNGYVAYYSNRCPYSEYHVKTSLVEAISKRNLQLEVVKLENMEQAQTAPTPATIFSLFHNGKFITTDLSICMDSRFVKIVK